MNKEILERCAYHESGRVVFAYLTDYYCTSIQLNDIDAGKGVSKLNGGGDNPIIQGLLNGDRPGAFDDAKEAYTVASKLTILYSAGTCARVFFENGLKVNEDTDLDFPGQDSVYIEKLQVYMKQYNKAHPDDYLSGIVKGIFQRLSKPDIWKAIKNLAEAAVESYEVPLNRYTIEDTLMGSGFKINRAAVSSGYSVGVSETPDKPIEKTAEKAVEKVAGVKTKPSEIEVESPLDIVLKNYLHKIRTDWSADDVTLAANQLKTIFAKYN